MHKTMIVAVLFAAVARADAPRPPSTEDALVVHVAEAKWMTPKLPELAPGAQASPIAVDPASGANIAYARLAPGFELPMHWHTYTEYTSLISGKLALTVDGKGHEMSPGDYAVIPPKVHHKAVCAAGSPCILLTRRAGAADYNFVK